MKRMMMGRQITIRSICITLGLAAAALVLPIVCRAQQGQGQTGGSGQSTATQGSSQSQSQSQSSGQQNGNQQPAAAAEIQPGPVTGVFMGFLNNLEEGRSMMQYGVSVSESADSNPSGQPNSPSVYAMTSISGHLSLNRVGRRSDLTLLVSGGGLIYDTISSDDAAMAGISIGDSIQFRRWTLIVGDQLYYLPQTPFGFSGGLLGGLGGGATGGFTEPSPLQLPNSGILSLQNQQLSNNTNVQANITQSARATWTISAGFNILHFEHTGFLPSSGYSLGAGYNYQLTSRDTIGMSFTYGASDFGLGTNSLRSYLGSLNYGHRFSDHLAVQMSAGATDYGYNSPSQPSRTSNLTYAANGGVSYLLGRTALQVSASHGTFGGGGFLYGGSLTTAQASASRSISRFWQLFGGVGYADSVGLAGTPTAGGTYHSLFGSLSASREINPNVNLFLQAVVSHQTVSGAVCVTGIPCASPFTQYVASAGINWSFRPIPIQ